MRDLQEGHLYVGNGECASMGCLTDVTQHPGASISEGRYYTFFVRTAPSPITSSVVAVQIKTAEVPRRFKHDPVGVNLEREATPFACSRRDRKYFHLTEQTEDRFRYGRGDETTIDYDTYDSYHRFGRLYGEDDTILSDEFHIYYNDGRGCGFHAVRTDDPSRAHLFLMHSRNLVPGWPEALVHRFNAQHYLPATWVEYLAPNRAALAEGRQQMTQFTTLRMLLANYQKPSNAPGCFSFEVKAPRSQGELQVSFSDLEEAQFKPLPDFFAQTLWVLTVR